MISFIVPALLKPSKKQKSDEEYLYRCLDYITAEIKREKDDSEIITVIKCQEEEQSRILRNLVERYDHSVRCRFYEGNRSEARNLGAKLVKGDILTFVDADTLIGEGFLRVNKKDFAQGYGYVNNTTRPLPEDLLEKRRLRYYATFMGLNQWGLTLMGIYRPYGYCMSVKKDICNKIFQDGEIFNPKISGYGEDSKSGGLIGTYCRENGIRGKYEKGKYIENGEKKRAIVYTSFRGWREMGFWRGGVKMIVEVFILPLLKEPRPLIGNWRDRKEK